MQVRITARHCVVADSLRERARASLARVASHGPRALGCTLVFDIEDSQQTVEARLRLAGGDMVVARAIAPDHRTALDRLEGRLRRQLEKQVERPRTIRRARAARV